MSELAGKWVGVLAVGGWGLQAGAADPAPPAFHLPEVASLPLLWLAVGAATLVSAMRRACRPFLCDCSMEPALLAGCSHPAPMGPPCLHGTPPPLPALPCTPHPYSTAAGDAVVTFNFRADRVIELSKALEYQEFTHFDRK